jgi:hypothetical protein
VSILYVSLYRHFCFENYGLLILDQTAKMVSLRVYVEYDLCHEVLCVA